ncbi:DUF945 family protein [Salinisphaera sp.]|uniref:DUF945 family protein n=1 Tax=Salinisphaera sp. TaxID=1914330 RepID=UPI002D797AD1|nr:DUF945 family protein [Salinisphaera sp.]HET7313367.1 DUF945 family protein [Salinisphaera sp.]
MRFLIKTLIWGVVVLALLCVAAPYGVGWLVAARFDRVVAHLSVPGYLQVVSRDFDRGWFVSRATVVLRPSGPLCRTRPCPVITLDSRIDHGPLAWGAADASLVPVLAVVTTHADLTSLWPRYVFSPAPDPLTITSRIRLNSRGQAWLRLDGASFDVSRQHPVAHVKTAAVTGALQSGLLARRIDGLRLDWPSFSLVRQSGGHLAWRNVHFRAQSAAGGALANRHFSADSITLDNGSGHATRLTHVDLTMRRPQPKTTAVALNIEKLVLPDNSQGTFILEARQRGMNPLAWATLPGRWSALGGRPGGALNAPKLYRDIVPELLPGGSRIQIDRFELAMRDGAIRARGHIQAPPHYRRTDTAVGLLSQLQGRLRLSLPRPILRRLTAYMLGVADTGDPQAAIDARIDAGVRELVARDLIAPVDDGKRYRIQIVLEDGRMRINGRDRPGWKVLVDQLQAAAQGL